MLLLKLGRLPLLQQERAVRSLCLQLELTQLKCVEKVLKQTHLHLVFQHPLILKQLELLNEVASVVEIGLLLLIGPFLALIKHGSVIVLRLSGRQFT